MEPFPPNPDDPRTFGVDISLYNGDVDFEEMARYINPPVEYIMIRSGQGRVGNYHDLDYKFYYNWENSAEFFPRMAYHVIYPSESISAQVANVDRIFKPIDYDFGEGPLWIDFELHHNMEPKPLTSACGAFLYALREEFDIRVGVYSGNWFLSSYCVPQDWWADTDWWLAHYWTSQEHPGPPDKPNEIPYDRVKFHQTTSWIDGRLMGAPDNIRIDGNRFQGEDLYDYIENPPVYAFADWWPARLAR